MSLPLEVRFTERVTEELAKRIGVSYSDARVILNDSPFPILLKDDPSFVMHYSTKYWVDIVEDRYKKMGGYESNGTGTI